MTLGVALLVGGSALAEPSSEDAEAAVGEYVGDEVCAGCHEDLIGPYSQTIHARVLTPANARSEGMSHGCESCHGPGQAHVDGGGGEAGGPGWVTFADPTDGSAGGPDGVCVGCHRSGKQLFWHGSTHQSRGIDCTSCHQVMHQVSSDNLLSKPNMVDTCGTCHPIRRSQLFRNAHMPLRQGALQEGFMDCGSCHNPHGTVTPSLIDAISTNDKCYSCHADKRGPFLWEHAPVQEDCTNCHDPHGSITNNMLKRPVPQLCQSCHIASRHPSNPYPADDRRAFGRGCLHCHQNIHGSNHPSGMGFTR
jgi:DmsE family decaheme c-type cytochrome